MLSDKICKINSRLFLYFVNKTFLVFCQTPVLGLGLGVDFTFALDNNHNHNDNHNNPHLNFLKGTVLGVKEQGLGIRDKCQVSRVKG